jgi:hypothetical protein
MELATQGQLSALAQSLRSGIPRRVRLPRTIKTPAQAAATAYTGARRCCTCGHCTHCIQNAEWDAKFNLRFGESMKEYYSGSRLNRQVSLWSEL